MSLRGSWSASSSSIIRGSGSRGRLDSTHGARGKPRIMFIKFFALVDFCRGWAERSYHLISILKRCLAIRAMSVNGTSSPGSFICSKQSSAHHADEQSFMTRGTGDDQPAKFRSTSSLDPGLRCGFKQGAHRLIWDTLRHVQTSGVVKRHWLAWHR